VVKKWSLDSGTISYLTQFYHRSRGSLKIIAAIEDPAVIARILAHLGLLTRIPLGSPPHSLDLFETA
jgi:hypothetical protein